MEVSVKTIINRAVNSWKRVYVAIQRKHVDRKR